MAGPSLKMEQIPEDRAAKVAAMALVPHLPPELTDMDMDCNTASTPMSSLTWESSMDTSRNADDIEEIARLNAELLRLRAESVTEQDVIDTILNELTTVKDELASTKSSLSQKTSESIALRAGIEKQKRQYESLQKQTLSQPVANVTATPTKDADVRLLRLRITKLTTDLSDKNTRLEKATACLEKERKEWLWQSTELSTAQRDRDHLRAEYQSAVDTNKNMALEIEKLKEQDISVREANAQSAVHSDEKVRELQGLVQFFKSNSERLAKESRQLEENNRALDDLNSIKDRELDDERSANLALKMQAGAV